MYDWTERAKKVDVNNAEEEKEYDQKANNIDWSDIFFKLGHYLNLKKEDVWKLTIPQLNYFLKKVNSHIEFTVKVSSMSMGAMFGGGGVGTESSTDSTSNAEFNYANEDDIDFLGSIL